MLLALTFAAYTVTLDGRVVLPRVRAAVSDGHVLLPVRALRGRRLPTAAHTITVQRGAHVATIPARIAALPIGYEVVARLPAHVARRYERSAG